MLSFLLLPCSTCPHLSSCPADAIEHHLLEKTRALWSPRPACVCVCECGCIRDREKEREDIHASTSVTACSVLNEDMNDDTCQVYCMMNVTVWCVLYCCVCGHFSVFLCPCARVCMCVCVCVWERERERQRERERSCLLSDIFWLSKWQKNVFCLDTSFNGCHFNSHTAITLAGCAHTRTHSHTEPCIELLSALFKSDGRSIDAALSTDKGPFIVPLQRILNPQKHLYLCWGVLFESLLSQDFRCT